MSAETLTTTLQNGKTDPWLVCKGCGVASWYNPKCHQCERDLLADIVTDLGATDGVLLSEFLFKHKVFPAPTAVLPSLHYAPPTTIEALISGGPSIAGWSVTSAMMDCPFRGQMMMHGVRSKTRWTLGDELDHLGYGLLMHALLAVRWLYGMDWAFRLLYGYVDIHPEDRMKAEHALKIYDEQWPRENEPWVVLGIETEVITEIAPGIVTSVRYDAIVKPWERDAEGQYTGKLADHVISLERKTTASGGESTMMGYTGQFYTQVANWNFNAALVEKYGPMVGVIGDLVTKHVVPRAERIGPKYISKFQQAFAKRYLSLKTQIRYPMDEEGRLPQMLHACISRYGPCQYFALCHDDARNSFEVPQLKQEAA